MKLRPAIQSDAESVAIGSCTRRGQRDVSLPQMVMASGFFLLYIIQMNLLISLTP